MPSSGTFGCLTYAGSIFSNSPLLISILTRNGEAELSAKIFHWNVINQNSRFWGIQTGFTY